MMGTVEINGVKVDLDKTAQENKQNGLEDVQTSKDYSFANISALKIHGVGAKKLDVQPHDSNEIEVVVSGPQSVVDKIKVTEEKGTVVISGDGQAVTIQIGGINIGGCSSRMQINSGNARVMNIGNMVSFGNSVTIVGDGISINTNGTTSQPTLEIKVPVGADIEYNDMGCDITIGDVGGDLFVDTSGSTSLTVGSIANFELDASGSCAAGIRHVKGDVDIDASGNSSVVIHDGEIQKLDVDLSGNGKVDIRCTAQRAKLDASGMCSIYVERVVKTPRQDSSGMSRIRIGHIG